MNPSYAYILIALLVIQYAKKTGDYSVLSAPDLAVLALTYALQQQDKAAQEKQAQDEQSIQTVYSSPIFFVVT